MLALKNFKKFKILCVPNFIFKWKTKKFRTAILYIVEDKLLYFSSDMVKQIDKCRCNNKTRFIFISFFILYYPDDKLSHANIIVIDLHKYVIDMPKNVISHSILLNFNIILGQVGQYI